MGSSSQWVLEFRTGSVRAIGAVELLAAIGLILHAAVASGSRPPATCSTSAWPCSSRGGVSVPSPSPADAGMAGSTPPRASTRVGVRVRA
nr:hypothetical protein [Streptomyces sp. RFCAC02]